MKGAVRAAPRRRLPSAWTKAAARASAVRVVLLVAVPTARPTATDRRAARHLGKAGADPAVPMDAAGPAGPADAPANSAVQAAATTGRSASSR